MIQLSDDYRVRELDDLQWVLERRSTAEPGRLKRRGGEWKAHAYCRSRAGLETALSRLLCQRVHPDRSSITTLPDWLSKMHQRAIVGLRARRFA